MSPIKCFDLSPQVHTQGAGPFWLQFLSSDGEGVIHFPACFSIKTTSWVGVIRAKLICVVMACTRVIYSRAGFGQTLLAWLASEPTCTNSFSQNWSRLPQVTFLKEFCYTSGNHGSIWANFWSPSKTTKLVQISIGQPERAPKNAATERSSFLREF